MSGFNFDFSKDKPNIREAIPRDTKLLVRMNYTPGGATPPESYLANVPPEQHATIRQYFSALTKAKPPSDAYYLNAEFTVLRGPYRGRKFFENMTMMGGKVNEKGESIAAGITRGNIRAILDASSGLSSKDESPTALAKRVLPNGFADLQARVFAIKVGYEAPKDGYAEKNKLGTILTIDHKDYPKSEEELDNPVIPGAPKTPSLPAVAAPPWGTFVDRGSQAEAPATAQAAAPAPSWAAPATPAPTLTIVPPTATAFAVAPPAPTAPAAPVALAGAAPAESPLPAWMRP